MSSKNQFAIYLSLAFLSLFGTPSVIAATKIELSNENLFQERVIQAGSVQVIVTTKKPEPTDSYNIDVHYKILYNNVLYAQESTSSSFGSGFIQLQDLDSNGTAEVIVSTYSGGAHCCTSFLIYNWQNNRFIPINLGNFDGNGGLFNDLNKDGKYEFTTYDNAFLYVFSSYAGSFPPSLIFTFNNDKFTKTTRKYRDELKTTLVRMYEAFLENKKENSEVNGILAGYVAQKILLGEYEEGWKFMLANYDRTSDWGLDIYQGNDVVGKYPDFPAALRAFLIEGKYLDRNGKPLN